MSRCRLATMLALLLAGCGGQPYGRLLEDARQVSGCESVSYVTTEEGVYVVDACGKTLRMRCQSEWNDPWCCREESAPPRTDCAAEDPPTEPRYKKPGPAGLNTPL